MAEVPPVLDYATPRRDRQHKPPTPARVWFIVWTVLLGFVFVGSLSPSQSAGEGWSGRVWAVLLLLVIFLVTLILPSQMNKLARRRSMAELPVPRGYRIALRILLTLTLLVGSCIQSCPHGTFLHISSATFTLKGGPPCRNPPKLEFLAVWLLRKVTGG